MTKIAGRSGCEVNLVQTHSLQKDAAAGQQKKLSTAESASQAALTDKLEVANRSSLFSMQSQSAGGSLRNHSLAGVHSFEGRLLDSVRQRITRGLERTTGLEGSGSRRLGAPTDPSAPDSKLREISPLSPGTPGQVSGPSVAERIADANGRAVQGEGFSFRGTLVWQGIRRDQDPIMPGGVRDSSGIGDHSVLYNWGRLGPPIDETHTFREHYDSNGNVLGWTQEEEYRHTNGNIVARIRWRPAGGDGWGPWRAWVSVPNPDGTYDTTSHVHRGGGKWEIVSADGKAGTTGGFKTTTAADSKQKGTSTGRSNEGAGTKTATDHTKDTTTSSASGGKTSDATQKEPTGDKTSGKEPVAGAKDGGKKGLVAGGYGPGANPGDPRTGEAAVGTPDDLPGDSLVLMLENLGFGVLSRDLVWNPDTEAGGDGDTVHTLGRTAYGPGGRPEGPASSTGSPTRSLPINKDVFVTDPPLTEDLKRNPGAGRW